MMSEVPLIKLFLQHQGDFMSYLMAITRDFNASEEIFQNSAIVVMETAAKGTKIDNFKAWAKEVVRRQALYHLRSESNKKRRVRPVEPNLMEQISIVFLNDNTSEDRTKQERDALQGCVQQAKQQQRQMLAMRYEQQASFRDIGEAFDKTEGAVQRALSRLRKQLHDCVHNKLSMTNP